MKVRICFEASGAETPGTPDALFGASLTIGESASPVDYKALTEKVNKEAVLRLCLLGDIVKPEDMVFLPPEEFDLKYGNNREEDD